ncbi:MAG: hypothetical protein K8I27_07090 [Planctomycetes bacterium]|nr:hypothetical protein [Planctomycetota bacterium]
MRTFAPKRRETVPNWGSRPWRPSARRRFFVKRVPGPLAKVEGNELGSYYCYNRTYDINLGRWTSPDPAASPWSNLLDYALSQPLARTDPVGCQSVGPTGVGTPGGGSGGPGIYIEYKDAKGNIIRIHLAPTFGPPEKGNLPSLGGAGRLEILTKGGNNCITDGLGMVAKVVFLPVYLIYKAIEAIIDFFKRDSCVHDISHLSCKEKCDYRHNQEVARILNKHNCESMTPGSSQFANCMNDRNRALRIAGRARETCIYCCTDSNSPLCD